MDEHVNRETRTSGMNPYTRSSGGVHARRWNDPTLLATPAMDSAPAIPGSFGTRLHLIVTPSVLPIAYALTSANAPCRPQTNGEVERFNRTGSGRVGRRANQRIVAQRTAALDTGSTSTPITDATPSVNRQSLIQRPNNLVGQHKVGRR